MRPILLFVVQVPQVRLEPSSVGGVRVHIASQMPLAYHMAFEPCIIHVLRHELSQATTRDIEIHYVHVEATQ